MKTKEKSAPAPAGGKPEDKPQLPTAPAAKVEHMTGAEAAQADAIREFGKTIIRKTGEVAGVYLDLCLYIRKHSVAPKLVSFELMRLGFKRSRISEVNRVANASEALFKQYEAKAIGFDKCLNMSRIEKPGSLPVASPAALLLEKNHVINADEVDSLVASENEPSGKGKPDSKKASATGVLKAAAKVLCLKSTREKVWRFEGGRYEVHVRLIPKTGPAVGDSE